jgi:cysteine desulfurase
VIGVGIDGVIDLDALATALKSDLDVAVVSVMLANNEVGTVQPLDEVIALVRQHAPRAVVHTDAVQAFPWLDVAFLARDADLVAVSAHKFGGPKGVGALVVRSGTTVAPLLHGGGQEADRRSGTHNMAGIAGMAAAMTATVAQRAATVERVGALRDRLGDGLQATVADAVETVPRDRRIAGNCHMRFAGIESESLLFLLDEAGVFASAGSACASGAIEPSHVLTAMGVSPQEAASAVRFSLGTTTTEQDVDLALKSVPSAIARLRGS